MAEDLCLIMHSIYFVVLLKEVKVWYMDTMQVVHMILLHMDAKVLDKKWELLF
jgi:hypothetical protein